MENVNGRGMCHLEISKGVKIGLKYRTYQNLNVNNDDLILWKLCKSTTTKPSYLPAEDWIRFVGLVSLAGRPNFFFLLWAFYSECMSKNQDEKSDKITT